LPEHDGDEETYSLIFKSLKHPIRRGILRLLVEGQMTFTEVLKSISIDSGHLSYHLDELSILLTKNADGTYALSGIGSAAVKLMNGVEDEATAGERYTRKIQPLRNAVLTSTMLLVLILLPVIAYSLGYVVTTGGSSSLVNVTIPSREAFSYKVTLLYEGIRGGYTGSREQQITLDPPVSGIMSWDQDTVYYTLSPEGGSHIIARIIDSSGTVVEEPEIFTGLGAGGASMTFHVPMNGAGSSRIEVDTISAITPSSGSLQVGYRRAGLTRPFFLYGVASIAVVSVCLLSLYGTWRKTSKL
jgi:DNA-binding transcriptional ArsR family regulator